MYKEKRAKQIVAFLQKYQKKHGYSPTIQEIADSIGISRQSVSLVISELKKRGVLTSEKGKIRSLKVKNMETITYYKIYYNVVSDENWNMYPDEDSIRVYFYDNITKKETAPSDNGITMEDVGEEEWTKIEKAVHNYLHPDGGIDWIVIGEGEQDAIIVTK